MIRTYDRTMFIANEELQKAKVRLYLTEGLKWEDNNEAEVVYTGLTKWSIIDGEDALKFEAEENLNELEKDENHEYLILEFNNGSTATFRNSHVDMFIR